MDTGVERYSFYICIPLRGIPLLPPKVTHYIPLFGSERKNFSRT